ncbi:MAG: alpha/beta fold hydrolase [Aeromicrobium sp.]
MTVFACCVLLTGCGGSDSNDRAAPSDQPVDGMFEVGDRKLHLTCDGSGSPTVILEAGLTGDQRTWDAVVPKIASATRVCAYDRANISTSEAAPTPRTVKDMVTDLHALVESGELKPPYVLVGFSFGGLVSQLYASTYPDDVAGLVLIESNHPDEMKEFEAKLTPAQIKRDRREAAGNPEGVDIPASFDQVQEASALPDRPLVVITAGQPAEWPPGWDAKVFDRLRAAQQKDLAGRVSDGTQIIAKESGHEVPSSAPEVVVQGIETVLAKIS